MTYPLGEDPLDGKPCEKCPDYATNCAVGCDREGDGHDSDCATHDAPAYPKGACDCSAQDDVTQYNPWRAHIYAVMEGGSYFGAQDWNDLLAYMDGEHNKIINLDDQVKQLSSMVRQYETALRIKNEEHRCCAEDLLEARKDFVLRWRDVVDELPQEAQEVLFVRGGKTVHGAWIGGIFWHSNQKMAAATWMPLPKPPKVGASGTAKRCEPCRETGAIHCSDPANCGGPWDTHNAELRGRPLADGPA